MRIFLSSNLKDKSKINEEETKLLEAAEREFELIQKTINQSVDTKA